MRLSELGRDLLVCHTEEARQLSMIGFRGKPVLRTGELYVFDMGDGRSINQVISGMPNLRIDRYLDRFYIWTPQAGSKRRQDVLDTFFELIAYEYESLIDVDRNRENIRYLLGFLRQMINPIEGATIVDYGCGTGLSAEWSSALDIRIVGIDRCPTMRQIAAGRGMTVWSHGDLARQRKDSIDGGFASYVFHLLPDTHGLRLLWSRLKVGGAIVANFHKGGGTELLESFARQLNGCTLDVKAPSGSERHGPYAVCIKTS